MNNYVKYAAVICATLFCCSPVFADDDTTQFNLPHSALWTDSGRAVDPQKDAVLNTSLCMKTRAGKVDDGKSSARIEAQKLVAACQKNIDAEISLFTRGLSPADGYTLKRKIERDSGLEAEKEMLANRQADNKATPDTQLQTEDNKLRQQEEDQVWKDTEYQKEQEEKAKAEEAQRVEHLNRQVQDLQDQNAKLQQQQQQTMGFMGAIQEENDHLKAQQQQ